MTDDEAFIHAIVDSPGDEGPRLVYAEWLEQRGDARGVYLRAEQEAVNTGDTSTMKQLAVGLDSVWVARVTLPPLGVCCEHIQIRDRGPVVDAQTIEQFEQQLRITLPDEYRAFLLNYNGGIVGEPGYETPDGEVIDWALEHTFYSLMCRSGLSDKRRLEWWASFRSKYIAKFLPEYVPDSHVENWFFQYLPVGHSPDLIFGLLLGVAGPAFGQVRYFDWSVGFYPKFLDHIGKPYARSFAEYLFTLPSTGYP
jgi:uncharacterized protein (TIGR02996 family)